MQIRISNDQNLLTRSRHLSAIILRQICFSLRTSRMQVWIELKTSLKSDKLFSYFSAFCFQKPRKINFFCETIPYQMREWRKPNLFLGKEGGVVRVSKLFIQLGAKLSYAISISLSTVLKIEWAMVETRKA